MDVPVYNIKGDEIARLTIDEQSLGGTVNPALIKQAYVMYHANLRQGSARTKTRHEVEGSTKKMYKQKGTGNARHGNKKPPHFRGGGHSFAKKKTREDYHLTMPKKMRRKANRNALLAKLVDNEVKIIDDLSFTEPRTRAFADFLRAVGVDHRALLALSKDRERSRNVWLSARNVDDVNVCCADQLTAFEMLNHRYLVIGRAELEAWLAGPSSQTGKAAKTDPMGRAAQEVA
ncbi:MAG TPA: 50S ribosomal protein L4 [Phycisphaerales bacterium]|nr:50S ribosomal protein L4 [Phycisphaerales bacterium]